MISIVTIEFNTQLSDYCIKENKNKNKNFINQNLKIFGDADRGQLTRRPNVQGSPQVSEDNTSGE